jgi:hypothetical protein
MKATHTKYFFFFFIGMVLMIASCSKGGEAIDNGPTDPGYIPSDTTAPVITYYTPVADQVFANSSPINISGKITDDYGLYRGTIKITDDGNGLVVLNKPYETHGLVTYNFNLNHIATVSAITNYTITVSFEDHGYNTTSVYRKIKVNP